MKSTVVVLTFLLSCAFIVAVAACMSVMMLGTALTQQPTRHVVQVREENRERKTDDGASNQIGTQRAPLVVRFEQTQEQKEAAEKAERQSEESIALTRAQTGFNRILAFCGVATLFVIGFQVWINRGQLATQRAELRAYISVKMLWMYSFSQKTTPSFRFAYLNYGVTPAKSVGFRAITRVHEIGTPLPSIDCPWNTDRMDLFPNANLDKDDRSYTDCNTRAPVTESEIEQIRRGQRVLLIGIEIKYSDVFGDPRTTRAYFYPVANADAMARLTTDSTDKFDLRFVQVPGGNHFT